MPHRRPRVRTAVRTIRTATATRHATTPAPRCARVAAALALATLAGAEAKAQPTGAPARRSAPATTTDAREAQPARVDLPALWTAAAPGATLACAPAPAQDLAALSDEFDGTGGPDGAPDGARWRWFHEAYGWPSMLRASDVGRSSAGALTLVPAASGWFADNHAPYLFQAVRGDFDVTARVRATPVAGGADSLPRATWSLVGLMARAPRAVTPATWAPYRENWLFITTGTAEAPGVPVFETKSTVNSGSNLKLRPARAGWMELRIVRLREVFLLLSRMPGEGWRVRERVLRRDMPWAEVQVGIVAYSDGTNVTPPMRDPRVHNTMAPAARAGVGRPDLAARVDYVRFRRPPVLVGVAPDWLVDHEVREAAILEFLACGEARGDEPR